MQHGINRPRWSLGREYTFYLTLKNHLINRRLLFFQSFWTLGYRFSKVSYMLLYWLLIFLRLIDYRLKVFIVKLLSIIYQYSGVTKLGVRKAKMLNIWVLYFFYQQQFVFFIISYWLWFAFNIFLRKWVDVRFITFVAYIIWDHLVLTWLYLAFNIYIYWLLLYFPQLKRGFGVLGKIK